MKAHFFTLLLLALALTATADKYRKREVRGAWIATVYNIDWPAQQGYSTTVRKAQQKEMQAYLDTFQLCNFNAIYFQVRPMADALYKSSYEPWSAYLTGTRGRTPGWDPMQWMVEECHKRGMECHAWLNPYRFAKSQAEYDAHNTTKDKAVKSAGMLIHHTYSGNESYIFNPALPATRQRIVDVCRELIENYDIDGIIFDDYFYINYIPESSAAGDYGDYKSYKSQGGTLSIGDWRRANVNQMVADVYNMIQEVNPSICFGISPAGVSCSDATIAAKHGVTPCPKGSDWQYNAIYSDPVAWLQQGTIDYISPQIYWKTNHSTNPYREITDWWSSIAKQFGRHHYASHSLTYMQTSNTLTDWTEAGSQLQANRTYTKNNAPGSIWYSACDIDGQKVSGFGRWLLQNKYQAKAIPPAINWKDCFPQQKVRNLKLSDGILSWDAVEGMRYCVYAIPEDVSKSDAASTSSAKGVRTDYLLDVTYEPSFQIPTLLQEGYYYAVSVLDRFKNEYEARYSNEPEVLAPDVTLVWPEDEAILRPGVELLWTASEADGYMLEVSRNKKFTDLIISSSEDLSEGQGMLCYDASEVKWNEQTYYWRVRTTMEGAEDVFSPIRSFTISHEAEEEGTRQYDIASEISVDMAINQGELTLSRNVDEVRVYTMSGILVAHETDTRYVNLNYCSSGVYIVKVKDKYSQFVKKIIVG